MLSKMINVIPFSNYLHTFVRHNPSRGKAMKDQKTAKALRLYHFISQINKMIVRTTDEQTLFNEACRIAVTVGKFKMAWIGTIDEKTKKVIPVMYAGQEQNYLAELKSISVEDIPEGRGPIGTALRKGEYVVCNDIENDSIMAPWKTKALNRDYRSMISLPIKKFGKVVSTFALYASEPHFFDEQEIILVEEVILDISFSLENFEKEKQRQWLEGQVSIEKNLSNSAINSLPGLFYLFDTSGKFIRWNKNMETVSGFSAKEISEMTPDLFFEGEEKELVTKQIQQTFTEGHADVEAHFVTKKKERIPFFFTGLLVEYEDKPCLIGTGIDITERKNAFEKLVKAETRIRNFATHLNHSLEEERATISREIHDELGQQLTALKMDIAWVLHKQTNTEEKVIAKFKEILQMSDGVINTIRRISSDLRPAVIDDLGLIAALEWKCNDFEEKTGLACHFVSTVKERKFETTFGINIYRILQETLTNVSRHAEAKSVSVSVSENKKELFLEIADDGKGISIENIQNGKTLGITGMKERATLLGGKLLIEGTKNKGTHTKLIVPLKNEYTIS